MDSIIDNLYIQYFYYTQVGSVSVPIYEDVPAHNDYKVSVKDLGEASISKEDWNTF